MAAATTFVTVEEYLRSSFEPDAEYVDGEIEERPAEKTIIPRGRQLFVLGSSSRHRPVRFVFGRS